MKVGDRVLCRLFNTPENKYYGELWEGRILEIDFKKPRPYLVDGRAFSIHLHRKEIKRVL